MTEETKHLLYRFLRTLGRLGLLSPEDEFGIWHGYYAERDDDV